MPVRPEWSVYKTASPVDSTVNLSLTLASLSQSDATPLYLMIDCKNGSPNLLLHSTANAESVPSVDLARPIEPAENASVMISLAGSGGCALI